MLMASECAAEVDRTQDDQNSKATRYTRLEKDLQTLKGVDDETDAEARAEMKRLAQEASQAKIEYDDGAVTLGVLRKNQEVRQRQWVQDDVIPTLYSSGLLNTTVVSPSLIVPAVASSVGDVSQLQPGPAPNNGTGLAVVQE